MHICENRINAYMYMKYKIKKIKVTYNMIAKITKFSHHNNSIVNENALDSEDGLKYNKVRPSNYLFQLFLTL